MAGLSLIAIFAALGSIPFLRPYLNKLKVGVLEVEFLKLGEGDQILFFLETIAREEQWTFYAKRENEGQLGEAFPYLIEKVRLKNEDQLINKLKEWLQSGEPNLIWFASEVIGYFEIEELKNDLLNTLQTCRQCDDVNKMWPTWALNCKWAASIFDDFSSLNRFLLGTTNRKNRDWLLDAYEQMLSTFHEDVDSERWAALCRGLQDFIKRSSGPMQHKAQQILERHGPREMPVQTSDQSVNSVKEGFIRQSRGPMQYKE